MKKEKELAASINPKDAEKVLKFVQSKRGFRLKGNNVKIGQLGNKQFMVTIPKSFALGLGFKKGSIAKWEIVQDGLLLKSVNKDGCDTESNR